MIFIIVIIIIFIIITRRVPRLNDLTRESRQEEQLLRNLFMSQVSLPSVSEFNEFEPRLKSAKNLFQLCTGLNLETLNTILSETNSI